MARLSDRVALVTDAGFAAQVAMAAVIVALDVIAEPAGVPDRPLRVALALAVLGNPIAQGARLTAVVVADNTLADRAAPRPTGAVEQAELDTAIVARLRATWNALAGVTDPS